MAVICRQKNRDVYKRQAIAELDALIKRVEGGEELDETTLEAAVAKVNKAIDEFKNSKYYNLSPEAQQYINKDVYKRQISKRWHMSARLMKISGLI